MPALALLGGLPMPVAIGTSLVVIAMKPAAGLAGDLASVTIDWQLAAAVTGAAVLGALLGGPWPDGSPRRLCVGSSAGLSS